MWDDILDNVSASFASYDLKTSIGPIVGSSEIDPSSSFPTTGGAFVLTSAGDATFTAATIGNSRALQLGDDADWLRRPRVRGISPGKGGPRNSRRLAGRQQFSGSIGGFAGWGQKPVGRRAQRGFVGHPVGLWALRPAEFQVASLPITP